MSGHNRASRILVMTGASILGILSGIASALLLGALFSDRVQYEAPDQRPCAECCFEEPVE